MVQLVDYFNTIQGEGKYAGTLATFIRFPGCNLYCGLKEPIPKTTTKGRRHAVVPNNPSQNKINRMKVPEATWVCDTMEQWRQPGRTWEIKQIIEALEQTYNNNNYHVVFTGGEPLMHKDDILAIIDACEHLPYPPSLYEIESNATINPIEHPKIAYNLSPKLGNSGLPSLLRMKQSVLAKYFELEKKQEVYWKFVVNRIEDVYESFLYFPKDNYNIPYSHVYFMPGAYNRRSLVKNSQNVIEFCKKVGINYSPRLQVFIYDRVVGV